MTGHDIHQPFRYLHPRQIVKHFFQSFCRFCIIYIETDKYNQDKSNYQ